MKWDGKVPLLGFEDEFHGEYGNEVLHVPVRHYGHISVYAWNIGNRGGKMEGYNIFFLNDNCPIKSDVLQALTPFDAKVSIQDFLNRVEHFHTHGEII